MTLPSAPGRLQPLRQPLLLVQGLRALAAMLVLVGHSGHDAATIAERLGVQAPRIDGIDWGFGVHLFFVISGFIMVLTAADDFGRPGAARTFLLRRIVRVVPLYWAVTTALLAGTLVLPRLLNVSIEDWRSILASYLFIPYPRGNGEIRPVMALGWTLNYEMFFYAVFALAMLLPVRRGIAALVGFFVGLVALGQLVSLPAGALGFWSSPIVLEFVLGVLVGLAYRRGWRLGLLGAGSCLLLGISLAATLTPGLGDAGGLGATAATGLPASLLVLAAALGPQPTGDNRLVRMLAFLGDASYSLYLVHPFVIRPLRDLWIAVVGERLPLALYVVACFAAAIAGAVLCYVLFERPLTRFFRRHRSQGRTAPAARLAQADASDAS